MVEVVWLAIFDHLPVRLKWVPLFGHQDGAHHVDAIATCPYGFLSQLGQDLIVSNLFWHVRHKV